MSLYPDYLLVSSKRYRLESWQVAPRLLWIPHDRYRYDYDDQPRDHSLGWKYNPAGTGKRRESASVASQPEVYRIDPEHGFRLPPAFIDLLCAINPELSRERTLGLLEDKLAFCNGEDARFDQPRLCGGAVVEEDYRDGDRIYIKTLRVDQPVPRAADVLANRALWFHPTGVRPDGGVNVWWRKGLDGKDYIPRMFVVSAMPVYLPADECLRVDSFVGPQWVP